MNKISRNRILSISACVVLGLLFLFPIYLVLVNSLKTPKDVFTNTLGLPKALVVANYPKAWKTMGFGSACLNSVFISIGSITLIVITSAMAAWVLAMTKTKISNFIFISFIAAMVIPFQSVMLPLVAFMGRMRLLNTLHGLIFIYLGFGSSLSIFLYHGFIKSIPYALEEAATIDGCPRAMILWRIIFLC